MQDTALNQLKTQLGFQQHDGTWYRWDELLIELLDRYHGNIERAGLEFKRMMRIAPHET